MQFLGLYEIVWSQYEVLRCHFRVTLSSMSVVGSVDVCNVNGMLVDRLDTLKLAEVNAKKIRKN